MRQSSVAMPVIRSTASRQVLTVIRERFSCRHSIMRPSPTSTSPQSLSISSAQPLAKSETRRTSIIVSMVNFAMACLQDLLKPISSLLGWEDNSSTLLR